MEIDIDGNLNRGISKEDAEKNHKLISEVLRPQKNIKADRKSLNSIDEKDIELNKLAKKFSQENWENLSNKDRIAAVIDLVKFHHERLRLDGDAVINILDGKKFSDPNVAGRHWVENDTDSSAGFSHIVDINKGKLNDSEELFKTIAHECKHGQQFEDVLRGNSTEGVVYGKNFNKYIEYSKEKQKMKDIINNFQSKNDIPFEKSFTSSQIKDLEHYIKDKWNISLDKFSSADIDYKSGFYAYFKYAKQISEVDARKYENKMGDYFDKVNRVGKSLDSDHVLNDDKSSNKGHFSIEDSDEDIEKSIKGFDKNDENKIDHYSLASDSLRALDISKHGTNQQTTNRGLERHKRILENNQNATTQQTTNRGLERYKDMMAKRTNSNSHIDTSEGNSFRVTKGSNVYGSVSGQSSSNQQER